jgi:serine/threonine-protein kinase
VDNNVRTAEGARKEFGVNLVLTGSVQRAGERVLLTASLVDARTRKTLRSLSFDAQTDDSVALQEGVARRVAELLELELLPQEEPVLALGGTVVPGAYELYLGGWGYLQNYHKPDNLDRAVSLFQQALELDPDFALAHAGLGEAYWKKYEATKNKQWVEEARHACEHALTLEQRLAAAHTCLGTLYIGTGEYEKATSKFQHALERDPGSDDAWRGLARAYEARGRLEQAEATFQKAIALRPSYWGTHQNLGRFYYRQGRYSKAAPEFQRVIELAPDNVRGYYSLGALYHLMGRTDEAIALLERSLALEPTGDAYSNLGTFYFFQGRYAKAVSMFEKAAELAPNNYVVLGNLADAYRWAPGQAGKAAPAYQRAIELAQEQLQVNPRDASIPSDLAVYWAKLGETEKALSAIAVARSQAPGDVNILFKSVVVYHLAGQRERAVHALVESVRTGYSLAEIRADPELADLRRDPRYQQAVARESTGG